MSDIVDLKWLVADEADEFFDFAAPIYRRTYAHLDPIAVEAYLLDTMSPDMIRKLIDRGRRYAYIIHRGKTAGFVGYDAGPETLYLDKLYITEEYRGKGLGSEIIEFLKNLAQSGNLSAFELYVSSSNPGAIRFYESKGFRDKALGKSSESDQTTFQ